ncbi:phage head completion protein [Cellulomonas shaoxiangyii]|uniref:Head-tail adaptor protein n=1 Tax=Cellulomonas shaoxiangyii TaxID=2566013 RepID=A0A4P7SH11_9CELL|nr:hypothetical protein [Cellulomonas shaoxiangyii]QCB93302.1 hypothetical protein E5225_06805 [Cellulomonas shaoxiangyii]TGY82479.1 hypothetical protein E5226_13145 [Cellulomonas shaoxiangyii]
MAGEIVVRLRDVATGVDPYGNPVETTTETAIPGAFFAPEQASRESTEVGRESVTIKPSLYFPKSWPDITARDRVRVRGREYAVDGEPADWRSPWGSSLGGLVVTLQRVEG